LLPIEIWLPVKGSGDISLRFAAGKALEGFLPLMWGCP
jgi:hypothetical protein